MQLWAVAVMIAGTMAAVAVVPMEITFMDNGGNIFVLYEFIDCKNSYII